MSNIVAKQFNWARKIYKAVFKGTPNILTTEDVNREFDNLREGAYLSQRSVGVISNMQNPILTINSSGALVGASPNVVNGYVIVGGVKFDLPATIDFGVYGSKLLETSKEYTINLYARRTLVTFSDDATKEISGAKFEDGSVKEAAEHYVYGDEKLVFEERLTNDLSRVRPIGTQYGYEFIAPLYLLKVENDLKGDGEAATTRQYLKMSLTTPIEKCVIENQPLFNFPTSAIIAYDPSTPNNLYRPKIGHTLSTVVSRMYSRFYNLEKRIYGYTREGTILSETVIERMFLGATFSPSSTDVKLQVSWGISGGICVVTGSITFVDVNKSGVLANTLTFDFNVLPKPIMDVVAPYYNGRFINFHFDETITKKVPAMLSIGISDSPLSGKQARISVRGSLDAGINVRQEFSLVYLLKTNWLVDADDNTPVVIP